MRTTLLDNMCREGKYVIILSSTLFLFIIYVFYVKRQSASDVEGGIKI